jgi:hypothetical protein
VEENPGIDGPLLHRARVKLRRHELSLVTNLAWFFTEVKTVHFTKNIESSHELARTHRELTR